MKTRLTMMMLFTACAWLAWGADTKIMVSPNGMVAVRAKDSGYAVCFNQREVMDITAVGMGKAMPAAEAAEVSCRKVTDDYIMVAGKRSHCTNEANEYVLSWNGDRHTAMRWRIYNDGVAFRYEVELNDERVPKECTTYRIAEGTKRWMQQWTDSYEGFFPLSTTSKVRALPSFGALTITADGYNGRWGYPALLEAMPGVFALITEANIERQQSASCLYNDLNAELFRVVPDTNGSSVSGPWHTPWRVMMVGELARVVESTLVTDLSEPCRLNDVSWIEPGVVSWVYWAYNHGSSDINIIRKYVDMAATLHLPYVLIDAEWDEMAHGHSVEEAVAYAKKCGVKPLIWYNSSVGWVDGAPGPKYRFNDPEKREKEMAWCESIGVAGVKIDFFSGDNSMNMEYCIDLLECAARHHLLVNFHGATIPRGWQRTYPHLLSTEGVYGAEWYNNVPSFTNRAAEHNATLPFTRNVVGPMDYTPCAFTDSQYPHITTHAHELALTVLFESGLQHLADRPESFLAQPDEVKRFLTQLPASWDDTRLLSGYPGQGVVMARRKGDVWFVAGINGTDTSQTLAVPVPEGVGKGNVTLFADSGNTAQPWAISKIHAAPATINCLPRGGFVMVVR